MKVGARMQVSHFSDLSFDHFIQYSQMVNGKKKYYIFFNVTMIIWIIRLTVEVKITT